MFFKRSLEDRVDKAKKEKKEMNKLIEEYKPFIASTAQKKVGRFLTYGRDDELSIGMLAFKEAIDSYDRDKGKFLSFAKRVINLRLIDYYRKHQKESREVFIKDSEDDENSNYELGSSKAVLQYKSKETNKIRKLEILEYKKELKKWEINFSDLVKASPKQKRLRDLYKEIAKIIVNNKDILHTLTKNGRMPIKEIKEIKNIHRKKLERGRIYIIALVIVYTGDYELIEDYINRG
ncbi:MAG: RNA polymerase sigma-I factor [Firmicutes bacterium]|nr:RNA polymerase sigma-I factor [Bacillota bacterium]